MTQSRVKDRVTGIGPSERLKQAVHMLYEHVLQQRARSTVIMLGESKKSRSDMAGDNHQAEPPVDPQDE